MVRHSATRSPGTTPEDVAAFAEPHITELRDLAEGAGLAFLAYLLDLARVEALNAVARHEADRINGGSVTR